MPRRLGKGMSAYQAILSGHSFIDQVATVEQPMHFRTQRASVEGHLKFVRAKQDLTHHYREEEWIVRLLLERAAVEGSEVDSRMTISGRTSHDRSATIVGGENKRTKI
jgi:hypothetical protein